MCEHRNVWRSNAEMFEEKASRHYFISKGETKNTAFIFHAGTTFQKVYFKCWSTTYLFSFHFLYFVWILLHGRNCRKSTILCVSSPFLFSDTIHERMLLNHIVYQGLAHIITEACDVHRLCSLQLMIGNKLHSNVHFRVKVPLAF